MPIDKDGIIYVEEKEKKGKKKGTRLKDICLIITTCISLLSFVLMLVQNVTQRLEYKNHIEELELEKTKYEDMLKESKIQLRTSYVLCESDLVENLYLGFDDYNIKIHENEIMALFYDKQTKKFYDNSYLVLDDELDDKYSCNSAEVIFLRIDIVSNRIVDDLTVQCSKIAGKSNFDTWLNNFSIFMSDTSVKHEKSELVSIDVGSAYPSDMILLPLAVKYEQYDRSENIGQEKVYRIVYVPNSVSFYDEFNNQTVTLEVRDMFSDAFMSEYYYYGLG